MPPHSECASDITSATVLQCSTSYWKKVCRLVPSQKRDPNCGHTSDSSQQQGFSLEFQASQVALYSIPLSSILGAADVYLDGTWFGQLELVPHNTPWFKHDLDANVLHTLTIFPASSGPAFLPVDLFVLTLSNRTTSPDFLPNPDMDFELDLNPDLASEKEGSSGAIISIASLATVVIVVFICSVCFFLNRSRRRPGFHMPSVLVNVTSSDESNMDMDINNYHDNNRERHGYERYELSTMFSTTTTTTTTQSMWKGSDDRPSGLELQYDYQPRPQPQPLPEAYPSMVIPPNNMYASSSSQTQVSGSETPKRRLSWHEDQIGATNS